MDIQNQTVFVTGANRGIGRSLVEALLAAGAKRIYAAARTRESLAPIQALDPQRILPVELDITNPTQLEQAVTTAGDVQLLINNAGVLDFGSVLDAPWDAIRRNLDVNYYGTLAMARGFAPVLTANRGALVNILTLVALASMPGLGVYNAAKAAAWSMTQSLRADFAKRGVHVFAVFPGAVDTDMLKGVDMPKATPRQVADAILAGLAANTEDIFPEPMSQQLYAAWKSDHKAVERQFAAM